MSAPSDGESLPVPALGAAVLTAAVWGVNFVVIKVGVSGVPPLLLAALRFALSAFPALLFVKRPAAPWGQVAAYGLLMGVGQFGLLFTAIARGAPAGLSSIVLQAQAFFTALLAAVFLKEKVRVHNALGMLVAAAGLAAIALSDGAPARGLSPSAIAMMLLSAGFWAAANVVAKKMPKSDGLGLVVWSSLFSPAPLLGLSLALEGPRRIGEAFSGFSAASVGALAYLAAASTLLGYGVWNRLIMRWGASRIAPFSLLVPIFGVSAAAVFLGEPFGPADAAAAALVLGGLLIHAFGGRKGR